MTDSRRYERRHDEHAPPQDDVEKAIMDILTEQGPLLGRDLILEAKKHSFRFSNAEIRVAIWQLLDRGYLVLRPDRKLEAHPEGISPAPTDVV